MTYIDFISPHEHGISHNLMFAKLLNSAKAAILTDDPVAHIWLLLSVPKEVVFAASPISEEGESSPATAGNEKKVLGSLKKSIARSMNSFSHVVMRFNDCKTRGDAESVIANIRATPVCRVEIDVGRITGERVVYAKRPQNIQFNTADRNLPIRYESVPPKKWMKTLRQAKAATTTHLDEEYPWEEKYGLLEWEDIIGHEFTGKKLMDIYLEERLETDAAGWVAEGGVAEGGVAEGEVSI
jgi:hypothetical protein